jgi:hypothetical protein
LSEDEINDLIFGKLVLVDYYANCVKPRTPSGLNERTPFVEYVVSTRRREKKTCNIHGMLVEKKPLFSLGFISSTIYTTVPCHIHKRVNKNIKNN